MQSRLSRGPTARIFEWLLLRMLRYRWETLFEVEVFTSVPRGTCPASAEVEGWLCSWESQMDQLEGMKTGETLSSSFPFRSSARSLRSEARSSPRRKGLTLRLSFSEEGDREDIDELSLNGEWGVELAQLSREKKGGTDRVFPTATSTFRGVWRAYDLVVRSRYC